MKSFYQKALNKTDLNPENLSSVAQSILNRCQFSETVFASLSTGLIVFNLEMVIVNFNKQASRLFSSLKLKRPLAQAFNSFPEISSYLIETLQGKRTFQRKIFHLSSSQHSLRILEFICDPWVEEGRILGLIAQIRDITAIENEYQKNEVSVKLNSLLSMTAGVAHEIKNPLGAMSLYVDIFKKRLQKLALNDEKLIECGEVLSEEIGRLNTIITNFLVTLRPISISSQPVDLFAIIEDVTRLLRYDFEKHHVELILEKDPQVPFLCVDVSKIKQILLNLINNSMVAMEEGGRLTISLTVQDQRVALTVADTGKGIPESLITRIFDPYFTTSSSGTGLGLTIVYQIMKNHNGEIQVNSKEGVGTLFTLLFPIPQKEVSLLSQEQSQ